MFYTYKKIKPVFDIVSVFARRVLLDLYPELAYIRDWSELELAVIASEYNNVRINKVDTAKFINEYSNARMLDHYSKASIVDFELRLAFIPGVGFLNFGYSPEFNLIVLEVGYTKIKREELNNIGVKSISKFNIISLEDVARFRLSK